MKKSLCACLCLSLLLLLPACSTDLHADITLINASYDPTREFYEAYNEMFAAYWSEQSGQSVEIVQSACRLWLAGTSCGQWPASGCGDLGLGGRY